MCTVSYIKHNEGYTLTFNRDERSSRETNFPKFYSHNDLQVLYPKDVNAGGTWIASTSNGKAACLLNGAFEKHIRKSFYERSRGVVLLESFYYANIPEFVRNVNLLNVEPFTLLLLEPFSINEISFFEFRWDGEEKHLKPIDSEKPHIWSSATLYDSEIRERRKRIFLNWVNSQNSVTAQEVFQFQNKRHGLGNSEDFIMRGDGDLQTLSITQITSENSQLKFRYHDISSAKTVDFNLTEREVQNA